MEDPRKPQQQPKPNNKPTPGYIPLSEPNKTRPAPSTTSNPPAPPFKKAKN